jgi:hypothetical protein
MIHLQCVSNVVPIGQQQREMQQWWTKTVWVNKNNNNNNNNEGVGGWTDDTTGDSHDTTGWSLVAVSSGDTNETSIQDYESWSHPARTQ